MHIDSFERPELMAIATSRWLRDESDKALKTYQTTRKDKKRSLATQRLREIHARIGFQMQEIRQMLNLEG